jgi:ribose 5-phosphate isomerase A
LRRASGVDIIASPSSATLNGVARIARRGQPVSRALVEKGRAVTAMSAPDGEARARHKREAAERAVELVRPGMVVGLGTGSTAIFAVRRIGELLRAGQLHDVVGVPTSSTVAAEAGRLGIPLALDGARDIDLTIDGADEVDPQLDLIKGGGGALFHEKIVAQASRREVIVVDDAKLSPRLGSRWVVPVEVVPFAWQSQARFLQALGARATRRPGPDGQPFVTDEGNWILDCAFGPIAAPRELAARLDARTGIVEHGLFIGLATDVIVAGPAGIRHLTRKA